jgi:hypothetical protein
MLSIKKKESSMRFATIALAAAMVLGSSFALAQGPASRGKAVVRSGHHTATGYKGVGSPGPGGGVEDNRGYGANGSPDGPTSLSGAGPSTTGGGSAGGGSGGGGGGNGF